METIKAEEISQIISEQIKSYEKKLDISETGTVLSVGDGIARVYGVQNAMAMELLEFPGGIWAWSSIWKRTTSVLRFWVRLPILKKETLSKEPGKLLRVPGR